MTGPPDTLRSLWDGCLNARDTGGYRAGQGVTRHGVLFRSDNLCRLTDAGLNGFAASGIKTVIDVRSVYELDIDPNPFAASETVHYLNLPLQNEDDTEAMAQINSDISLPDMYRVMLRHFGANIGASVNSVSNAEGAVVIHCHAGKDRTGLVIALLLAALGVEEEAVASDYAASNHYLNEVLEGRLASANPEEQDGLRERLGAGKDTMLEVLETLRDVYGGVQTYLLRAGVSREALERLRDRLVEAA